MNEIYRQFAAAFAAAIVAQNYEAAHRMLAPWLQNVISPARLRKFVETEVREVADAVELDEVPMPTDYEIDSNFSTLSTLREQRSFVSQRRSNDTIPDEITEDNFRQWLVIQFMPSEEVGFEIDVDAWFDWWMLLVETDDALRIGYFELEDPD